MCWSSDTELVAQVINQYVGQVIHLGVDQVKISPKVQVVKIVHLQ